MNLLQLSAGITSPGITFDSTQAYLLAIKALLIISGILYAVFAGLIIRQVQLMRSTVKTQFSLVLLVVAILHFLASLLLLLYLFNV